MGAETHTRGLCVQGTNVSETAADWLPVGLCWPALLGEGRSWCVLCSAGLRAGSSGLSGRFSWSLEAPAPCPLVAGVGAQGTDGITGRLCRHSHPCDLSRAGGCPLLPCPGDGPASFTQEDVSSSFTVK